jgi:hypothetical protein
MNILKEVIAYLALGIAALVFGAIAVEQVVTAVKSARESRRFHGRAQRSTGRVVDVEQAGSKSRPSIDFESLSGSKTFRPAEPLARKFRP